MQQCRKYKYDFLNIKRPLIKGAFAFILPRYMPSFWLTILNRFAGMLVPLKNTMLVQRHILKPQTSELLSCNTINNR